VGCLGLWLLFHCWSELKSKETGFKKKKKRKKKKEEKKKRRKWNHKRILIGLGLILNLKLKLKWAGLDFEKE